MDSEEKPETRQYELLMKAADDLEAGHMLLNMAFLDENHVSAEEAHIVTTTVEVLLRGYLRMAPELQAMILLLGADTEHRIIESVAFDIACERRAQRRMKTGEDAEENLFPEARGR